MDADLYRREFEMDAKASADSMADLDRFDKKMKSNLLGGDPDSSSDEENNAPKKVFSEVDILKQKNTILMEKLFKSEK